MYNEEDCKSSFRFLHAVFVFSDKSLKYWKEETKKRCKEIDEAYLQFLNWVRGENEVAVFTMYAYGDFLVPKKFDCIFLYDNPEHYIHAEYKLTQSIWEGYFPIKNIENGHKHLCVLSFNDKIPGIFEVMHIETGKFISSKWKMEKSLGLCQMSDIQNIIDRHKKESELKELHGDNWYDFYQE